MISKHYLFGVIIWKVPTRKMQVVTDVQAIFIATMKLVVIHMFSILIFQRSFDSSSKVISNEA